MRVLVNALSVTNASGRHVLMGHLSRFAAWTTGRHEFVVLFHAGNRDICRDLGPNVRWTECPSQTSGWVGRSLWERRRFAAVARQARCDAAFSPAGTITSTLEIPQICFAQNPWSLVPGVAKTAVERLKAHLQRRAYRQAMRVARVMVFNSDFMRSAYRQNAGFDAPMSRIVYQGVDDDTFAAAGSMRGNVARKAMQIVSVSAMASHKGVETLVAALGLVRRDYGLPATLLLIGGWPDMAYRAQIEAQVSRLSLDAAVTFAGHVTRDALHVAYAESQVFSLMSRCESFGIPAIEAQAFGTPTVSSNCCAIPEICGAGGVFPEVDRPDQVAADLARILTERSTWADLSEAALKNVERFRWDLCARPFVELFDELGER